LALFGTVALVLIVLLRPMEIWPELSQLMPLELFSVFTAFAIGWEALKTSANRVATSQLRWLFAFVVWCAAVTIAKLGADTGLTVMRAFALGPIFMLLVAFALSSIGRLRVIALLLVAMLALMCVVAIHQGAQPRQCLELQGDGDDVTRVADGRECAGISACEKEGGRPDTDYECERVGLFGTYSSGGRVRWRGQLGDPNELAVHIGVVMPFVVWLVRKRDPAPDEPDNKGSRRRLALLVAIPLVALGLWTVILTQSRAGQIVITLVVLIIAVRRFGFWSIAAAVPLLVPVLVLSSREGAEADASSLERAKILSEGLELLRDNSLLGVGVQQFAREVSIGFTAHNSYLLVAAELGIPGCLLWCGLLWMSIKIPLSIALRPPAGLDPRLVGFAEALAISFVGLFVGVFFLSFSYKHIFLVWLGLAGALHGIVRGECPDFRVETTRRDVAGICAFAVLALLAVRVASAAGRG
jgi:hypothetical protein